MSHVPAENLAEYRRRRDWATRTDSLGNRVSGLSGDVGKGLAQALWQLSYELKEYANELRAPGRDESG